MSVIILGKLPRCLCGAALVHYGALKGGRAVPIQLTRGVGGGRWQIFGLAHRAAIHATSGGMVVVMEGLFGDG